MILARLLRRTPTETSAALIDRQARALNAYRRAGHYPAINYETTLMNGYSVRHLADVKTRAGELLDRGETTEELAARLRREEGIGR